MSVSVQARGNRHQLRVIHKLLPKPFFFTFDSENDARSYGAQLDALLSRGVVPAELLAVEPRKADDPLLIEVIRMYTKTAPITDSDEALLGVVLSELVGVRVSHVTYQWADNYVARLKTSRKPNLAPGTIRKRVGVMGRVMDWYYRRATPKGEGMPANVFRLLPKGYSAYSRSDAEQAEAAGQEGKRDQIRDVRLPPDQERAVMTVLDGFKRPDRERALQVDPAFTLLFQLILDTGMRLREAYRLRVEQIDLERRVINVEGTKGHRGVIKPRQVPIKPALHKRLAPWCAGHDGLVFPFWSGVDTKLELARTTSRLSVRFGNLFKYAGVDGFTEHDLRHEATCRWVELRHPRGGWIFSDIEVCRIMGWTDTKMMLRYASLRGEDLAARML
jgi:integrase